MPDNTYRGLHVNNIDRLTKLNKRFKEQGDDRIETHYVLRSGKGALIKR